MALFKINKLLNFFLLVWVSLYYIELCKAIGAGYSSVTLCNVKEVFK